MERIVVPLDGSELAERALGLGVTFATAYSAELELVHVLDDSMGFHLIRDDIAPHRPVTIPYLDHIAMGLPDDLRVTSTVLHGDPVAALLGTTKDAFDTMIVMSTHGRGGLGRLMLGSVTDKVLRGANVPVALVRGSAPTRSSGLHTILVPLDDSGFAEMALPLAADLAQRTDATLSLVQVCDPFRSMPSAAMMPEAMYAIDTDVSELEKACISGARRYLELVATERRKQGIRVTWEVRLGRPADEIIRATETTEANLIIMSTHGRGGIRRWAFGSVTNEVLHRGTIPILAIPPAVNEKEKQEMAEILSSV